MRFLTRFWRLETYSAWYRVVFYLALAVIWFFVSAGLYGERYNRLEWLIILFCESGLIGIVYLSRYLLFPNARSPRFFRLAAGLFLLIYLGLRFAPRIHAMFGLQGMSQTAPYQWGDFPLIFMDGMVLSLMMAWLAENIFVVLRSWCLLPRFAPFLASQFWSRFWDEMVKLTLLLTLIMILFYGYMINFLLVDTVRFSYLLTIPVALSGLGLFLLFSQKVSGWREEEIRAVDRELASYLEWPIFRMDKPVDFTSECVLSWVQYLGSIRSYLCLLKRPIISWWAVLFYFLCCATVFNLPNLLNVVVEV
jgi:hypothetical protein